MFSAKSCNSLTRKCNFFMAQTFSNMQKYSMAVSVQFKRNTFSQVVVDTCLCICHTKIINISKISSLRRTRELCSINFGLVSVCCICITWGFCI